MRHNYATMFCVIYCHGVSSTFNNKKRLRMFTLSRFHRTVIESSVIAALSGTGVLQDEDELHAWSTSAGNREQETNQS